LTKELKTLKDIEQSYGDDTSDNDLIMTKHLREEAIKWIKYYKSQIIEHNNLIDIEEKIRSIQDEKIRINTVMILFDITEEELK
jgi:hypothetical protein